MRVLVIGAAGLLGRALLQEWDSDQRFGASSRDADIRETEQVHRLLQQFRPECTVLTAAYTDVDGCEKNPVRAFQVNRDGAVNVARAVREVGSRLIHISTDYVFDGSKGAPYEPEDRISPINVYGQSKAEGEAGIREVMPESCIIRTSWLFGANAVGFVPTVVEKARTQKKLRVVDDQRGSPTFNRDLARAIVRLARAGAQGTLHVSNSGECSRYEFACELVKAAGLTGVTLNPATSDEFPQPARRPAYSVLSAKGLEKFGVVMRPWQQTLPDYFLDSHHESHAGNAVTM